MDTAIKGQGLGFVKEVAFNGSKNGEKKEKRRGLSLNNNFVSTELFLFF